MLASVNTWLRNDVGQEEGRTTAAPGRGLYRTRVPPHSCRTAAMQRMCIVHVRGTYVVRTSGFQRGVIRGLRPPIFLPRSMECGPAPLRSASRQFSKIIAPADRANRGSKAELLRRPKVVQRPTIPSGSPSATTQSLGPNDRLLSPRRSTCSFFGRSLSLSFSLSLSLSREGT